MKDYSLATDRQLYAIIENRYTSDEDKQAARAELERRADTYRSADENGRVYK